MQCREALAQIDALVDRTIEEKDPSDSGEPADLKDPGASLGSVSDAEGGVEALCPFFTADEAFRRQIRDTVLQAAHNRVRPLWEDERDVCGNATQRMASQHALPPAQACRDAQA